MLFDSNGPSGMLYVRVGNQIIITIGDGPRPDEPLYPRNFGDLPSLEVDNKRLVQIFIRS